MTAGAVPAHPREPRAASPARALALTAALAGASLRRTTSDRVLGAAWWFLDPLVLIGVYALVFGHWLALRRGPEGDAYPLFLACALVPWRAFAHATTAGAAAFQRHATLLVSVPVPRHAVVLAEQAAAWVQGAAAFAVLALFMVLEGRAPTVHLLAVPLALAVLVLLGAGASYLLCPLHALLSDTANAWGAVLRVTWFLSPGLWSLERLPPHLRGWMIALNPFVGIFEGVRRPVLDGLPPHWGALAVSAAWAAVLLVVGRRVFARLSPHVVRML